ncbi:MAG: DUF4129 domain-containing protein [Steroidobacteraceae bacterium]
MRFPADALILSALLACAGAGASAFARPPDPPPRPALEAAAHAPLTPDEVQAAAAKLRADPNLGSKKKIRSLRWIRSDTPHRPQQAAPWVVSLFEYLGQTGSVLLWVAGAIGVAIAAIWAYRTFKARSPAPNAMAAPTVSRVGEMDIRPDSLPEDIGAAALALAEAGKAREALSLLYRGALSRAVHRFGITIGESYTEGEALRAVGVRLEAPRVSYFSDLVGIWRRAVYAGEPVAGDSVRHLCRGFAAALGEAAP